MSNTILYESLGWKGLLIEPGPAANDILFKHRKAWVFHGALSPTGNSSTFGLTLEGPFSHYDDSAKVKVSAEPLSKILAAIEPSVKRVDFWSLDIEGSECDVLSSTDFEQLQVGIMLIEMNKSEQGNRCIEQVMERNGFRDLGSTHDKDGLVLDHVFINKAYAEEHQLTIPERISGLY